MKQLMTLIIATLVVGTVLLGCDSKPTPQNAEERAIAEGRRKSPDDPVAPPGPPIESASMQADTAESPPPEDD